MKEFLERAAKEQALSYRDLRIILDALPTPMSWATLHDGRIRFVNRAFKTLFGYTEDTFASVDEWIDKAYAHESQKHDARRRWEHLWKKPVSGIRELPMFELDIRCADGAIRIVQSRGILLHDIGIGIATFDDISDRKLAESALHRLAFEDPLTGLPNRRQLQGQWSKRETLHRAGGQDTSSAVLLIDLDGFKAINDRLGHDAGDVVLLAVAERLRESVRKNDLICRMGGDEFAILLDDIATHDQVDQVCLRIEAALSRPIQTQGHTVTIGASIGASLFPQDAGDLQELLKRADEALYRVKADRGGRWEWFRTPTPA